MNLFKAKLSFLWFLPTLVSFVLPFTASEGEDGASKPVSFHKEIRPLFQARCNGCHQPAKAKGDYVMTNFATLIEGGERDQPGHRSRACFDTHHLPDGQVGRAFCHLKNGSKQSGVC